MLAFSIYIVVVFVFGLCASRLQRTVITPPLLFTAAGVLTLLLVPEWTGEERGFPAFLRIAEVGLVLLLFSDASRTDIRLLRSMRALPVRLLSTGMLLTILLGAGVAMGVFPGMSLWEAGILAAILAPTDAGLGQVIVSSPLVPAKIRETLAVEAGLNDGLSVPFLLFFISLVDTHAASEVAGHAQSSLLQLMMEQLGYGVVVGAVIGLVGGKLLGVAHKRKWTLASVEPLALFALPILAMLASESVGASMFIAAFVAGLTVQVGFKEVAKHSLEFSEQWGQLLNLLVFFLFGMLIAQNWGQFGIRHVVYAVLSLTIVRALPVAIALWGSGLSRSTLAFIAWFGPRGLASIVLGLVYLEHTELIGHESVIREATMVTVLMSIIAHGLSAKPGSEWYAKRVRALPADAPELQMPPGTHG